METITLCLKKMVVVIQVKQHLPKYVKFGGTELYIQGQECFMSEGKFGREGNGFVLYPWENGNDPDANYDTGWCPSYRSRNILSKHFVRNRLAS